MPNVTLKGIAALLEEELKPIKTDITDIKTDISDIKTVQNQHTAALAQLLTEKKTKEDNNIVSAERFDRLEHWAQRVGSKLGIKLEL